MPLTQETAQHSQQNKIPHTDRASAFVSEKIGQCRIFFFISPSTIFDVCHTGELM